MKKAVVASLLVCACIALGARVTYAQAPPAGAQTPYQMGDDEFKLYNDAKTATTPQAQAAGYEAYLTKYPQSGVKASVLETLMVTYSQFDLDKAIDAADRLLQVDPANYRGLFAEASLHKAKADGITNPGGKTAELDLAASFAQKGLAATKPASMDAPSFAALQATAVPTFMTIIAYDALNNKNSAVAVDMYKKELAAADLSATTKPSQLLQDTFYLGVAYSLATPPDFLNCAYYTSRAAAYAPPTFQAQMLPTAKYCYRKYHGTEDGYDGLVALSKANLFPGDLSSIKPAPTVAEQIHTIITGTSDLGTLAIADKETIFQNGSPDDAAKVWDSIKGKSSSFPAVVIESSPTVLKVAVSDDAIQAKTADFTFNMAPIEEVAEPKATATPAQKAAYKTYQKMVADIAAATTVGSKVTLEGTYASYAPNPIMITMSDGAVVLPKATKAPAAKAPAGPAHRAAPHK